MITTQELVTHPPTHLKLSSMPLNFTNIPLIYMMKQPLEWELVPLLTLLSVRVPALLTLLSLDLIGY